VSLHLYSFLLAYTHLKHGIGPLGCYFFSCHWQRWAGKILTAFVDSQFQTHQYQLCGMLKPGGIPVPIKILRAALSYVHVHRMPVVCRLFGFTLPSGAPGEHGTPPAAVIDQRSPTERSIKRHKQLWVHQAKLLESSTIRVNFENKAYSVAHTDDKGSAVVHTDNNPPLQYHQDGRRTIFDTLSGLIRPFIAEISLGRQFLKKVTVSVSSEWRRPPCRVNWL
jgi:hypothetical protein